MQSPDTAQNYVNQTIRLYRRLEETRSELRFYRAVADELMAQKLAKQSRRLSKRLATAYIKAKGL
jgi:hypothetical protein